VLRHFLAALAAVGDPTARRPGLKTYIITTGTLFGVFAAWHVFELVSQWRSPVSDPGFTLVVAVIIVVCGALSVWAFRLLKAAGR
jgi:uncharacterized membrane protein required for colicin V production